MVSSSLRHFYARRAIAQQGGASRLRNGPQKLVELPLQIIN
jgi:hypothetical protein